jgi:hypothetical protein
VKTIAFVVFNMESDNDFWACADMDDIGSGYLPKEREF